MDTVEALDPTHPLYGKTLPLVGVTNKQVLGRVAIVWINPGVERMVPLYATSLADAPMTPPSPCRLSVASVERLLAVLASFPETGPEEDHGEDRPSEAPGAARAAPRGTLPAKPRDEECSPAGGVADAGAKEQGFGATEMGRRDEGGGF